VCTVGELKILIGRPEWKFWQLETVCFGFTIDIYIYDVCIIYIYINTYIYIYDMIYKMIYNHHWCCYPEMLCDGFQ